MILGTWQFRAVLEAPICSTPLWFSTGCIHIRGPTFEGYENKRGTLRQSKMAMENGPLISDFPNKTPFDRGFSIVIFDCWRVYPVFAVVFERQVR